MIRLSVCLFLCDKIFSETLHLFTMEFHPMFQQSKFYNGPNLKFLGKNICFHKIGVKVKRLIMII